MLHAQETKNISLKEVVGGGYTEMWNFKGRYIAIKGSRASKKSKTMALRWIVKMMQYPTANLLCMRKVYSTIHDSVFADLRWAVNRLGVSDYWTWKESPMEMTYKPTGQKILFRGCDDALKLTSITVDQGSLCWVWL